MGNFLHIGAEAWRDLIAGVRSVLPAQRTRAGRPARKGARAPKRQKIPSRNSAPFFTPGWRRRAGIEGVLVTISLGFVGVPTFLYLVLFSIAPEPPDEANLWAVNRLPSIVILDRQGEEIALRGARYGESVPVKELPDYFVQAILATEDRRFYRHKGVDPRGIARAAFNNIRTGTISEGGSTITQQLAKNLFLTPEQSYLRKAKEALLALWIEGRYDKDQILSLYLNRIYMGAGAYGVESAAQTYFGKSARDVTLSEAVLLAGLPKAPSALAPTNNPFGAQDRANEVLGNLVEIGAISAAEAADARLDPAQIVSNADKAELGYFFDYVTKEAYERVGAGQKDLIIHTTIDRRLQRAAEKAVKSRLSVDTKQAGATQSALIAYDNQTGALRAMVGGLSYVESQFNRATQAKRQPGSAFKPFVYAAAFENGLTPVSEFVDRPVNIAGWRPANYNNGYEGRMRLTEAMARSINTVAVQVSEKIGRDKVIELAHRMGLSSDIPGAEAGIALGAFSATLEDLTRAYIPFARGGRKSSPHAIVRIEDNDGNTLYQNESTSNDNQRVLDRKIATDMTHMLFQVVNGGTGARARLAGRDVVGKTGTTNDWRDAWFVGYSAQITAGVWVGNDEYRPMKKITGGALPAEIWKSFMSEAHSNAPKRRLAGAFPVRVERDRDQIGAFYTELLGDFDRLKNGGRVRRSRRDDD